MHPSYIGIKPLPVIEIGSKSVEKNLEFGIVTVRGILKDVIKIER